MYVSSIECPCIHFVKCLTCACKGVKARKRNDVEKKQKAPWTEPQYHLNDFASQYLKILLLDVIWRLIYVKCLFIKTVKIKKPESEAEHVLVS